MTDMNTHKYIYTLVHHPNLSKNIVSLLYIENPDTNLSSREVIV